MSLHLLKLGVGVESVAELQARVDRRRAAGEAEHTHTTRMMPTRRDDLLEGGSLYWVIRGQIAARQVIRAIRSITGADGIARCQLVFEPSVVAVAPRPCRPFQGWRYLADDDRPPDLDPRSEVAHLPEQLRAALRDLCLL